MARLEKRFTPLFEVAGQLPVFDDKTIKKEPMFYGASAWYAYLYGGPITRSFLRQIPFEFLKKGIIDTRVHMLMPGMYPCIPGWHHDDVLRTGRRDGQPDYQAQWVPAEHYMGVVSYPRNVAMPEFVVQPIRVAHPDKLKRVYKTWDKEIDKLRPFKSKTESSFIYRFDSDTFHRGTQADKNCWRWFGRITYNHCNTLRRFLNERRSQVNVYMKDINQGW